MIRPSKEQVDQIFQRWLVNETIEVRDVIDQAITLTIRVNEEAQAMADADVQDLEGHPV